MKTLILKFVFLIFSLSFLSSHLSAQEYVGDGDNGFAWKLIGRVFFDGGVLVNDSTTTSFQVNDIRLGAQFTFLKNWDAKIELGYGDSKISLKDVYMNYEVGEHSIRLGYQYEPFGNARVGTSNYRFMSNAPSDKAFGNKRKLGVSYSYNHAWFNFMGGIFSDGDIEKSKPLDQGYAIAAKFVGRPLMADKKLIHLGVAPRFSSGQKEVSFEAGIPTDLFAKGDNTFVNETVYQVINQWKLDAEVILLYNKWYFQGQYFLVHLNRNAAENYNGKGGYVQAGYMLLGDKHNYNAKTGMIVNPAPKSLELLCRYDKVDLNNAYIHGGELSNVSFGANYFINKFVAAKLNYTYMMVDNGTPTVMENFSLFQARLQFSF